MSGVNDNFDYHFKIVIIGDSGVGKSNLLLKYADDQFSETYISTIGVDFRFRTITIDGKIVKLQIWDTAGQERFRTITSAYYRGTDGILVVYDTTDASSYASVSNWLEEISRFVSQDNCKIMLIGNKLDAGDAKVVSTEDVKKRSSESDFLFMETSAKTGENVEEAFSTLARCLIQRRIAQNAENKKNAAAAQQAQQQMQHGTRLDDSSSSNTGAGLGCC